MPKMIYTGVESKNKVYLRNITERKRVTSLIQTRVAHNVNEFHFLYGFKSRAFLLFFSFCLLLLLCFCLFYFVLFFCPVYGIHYYSLIIIVYSLMRFSPLHLSPKILIFSIYTLDNIHRPMKASSHIKFGVRVWGLSIR